MMFWYRHVQKFADGLTSVLFPPAPACALCRGPGESGWSSYSCDRCIERLPPIASGCEACGRARSQATTPHANSRALLARLSLSPAGAPRTCTQCAKSPIALDHMRAYGVYEGFLRERLHALKYRGELVVARGLGELMAWIVAGDGRYGRYDAVVPVPLHPARQRARGYNQAEILAHVVGAELGRRCELVVQRTRETQAQNKLGWNERRANVRTAFSVPVPGAVRGRSLLLVDDVYTTGSTLSAVAVALKRAGARRVSGICAAASSLDVEFTGPSLRTHSKES